MAIRRAGGDATLAYIAAGPLEDLIVQHGEQFMDRIELEAGREPKVRRALRGVWGRPILTFQDFVGEMLARTPYEAVRADDVHLSLLLERAVDRVEAASHLKELGPAAKTEGFLNHVQSVVAQLKQAAIEPEDFAKRVTETKAKTPMDAVVAAVYTAYQAELRDSGVYDLQGMY